MVYTLNKGVNDRPERIRTYILRGLPIVIAAMIAIVGAFSQTNNGGDSANQEPLAIYTAPVSDFGSASNPQGNGSDTQSSGGTGGDTNTAFSTQEQARHAGVTPSQTSSSPAPTTTLAQPALPVGGSGGGDCPCQVVGDVIETTSEDTTEVIDPILPAPESVISEGI